MEYNETNSLIVKSNDLIEASYKLTTEEQRIILKLVSQINYNDIEFKRYSFKINEFIELLGIKDQSKYTKIPIIAEGLMKKVLTIYKTTGVLKVSWLSSVEYIKGAGIIELEFSPKLKPYLLMLKERFTSYNLKDVIQLKSTYSLRIYELLKQYQNIGQRVFEINKLKHILGTENKYKLYHQFKQRVIEPAKDELNNKTDIIFTYEEIKTGRKVTSIKFYINQNKSKNEIAIGTVKEKSDFQKDKAAIKQVQVIIKNIVGNEISDKTAKTFYTKAVNHKKYGDAPFELIEEVAKYSKTQNKDKGFLAWFTGTVEHYIRPFKQKRTEGNTKTSTFNDFEQREYDFEDLENKLLGIK